MLSRYVWKSPAKERLAEGVLTENMNRVDKVGRRCNARKIWYIQDMEKMVKAPIPCWITRDQYTLGNSCTGKDKQDFSDSRLVQHCNPRNREAVITSLHVQAFSFWIINSFFYDRWFSKDSTFCRITSTRNEIIWRSTKWSYLRTVNLTAAV